jgi:hypothetical protein
VARFLTPEWLARMAAVARESEALRGVAAGPHVSVRQVVRGGPDGDVAYTVRLGGGTVTVVPDGGDADLEVASDYATATAISQGRLSPGAAFASGRLQLGGRVGVLAAHAGLLSGLGDVFRSLRATTEY